MPPPLPPPNIPPRSTGDPAFDALLDRALAAPKAPPGLVDRIVLKTLPRVRRRGRVFGYDVIGRIGPARLGWARAAAAVIVLAAWGGLWAVAAGIAKDSLDWMRVRVGLDRVAQLASQLGPDDPIDRQIQLVRTRLDSVRQQDWTLARSSDAKAFDRWMRDLSHDDGSF